MGSIFFKQSLNVMCGRTSRNGNCLSSKCVGVTAQCGTWQACLMKLKAYYITKLVWQGQGIQYFTLQRRKPPLLTDYSLQWGKQLDKIFFSNLKSFTAHSLKYGWCGMDVYSHFNNLVLITVRRIFVAVFLFKKFY